MHFAAFLLFFLAVLTALALAGWAYWRYLARRNARVGAHDFERKALLTGNEIDFYRRLKRVLGRDFEVLPQVSMGAVMSTTLTPEHPDYWAVRESYAQKIIDFVICDPRNFHPLLVVELDDRMHDFSRDRSRDALVSRCGLRTVRFWSRRKPTDDELKSEIFKWLGNAAPV